MKLKSTTVPILFVSLIVSMCCGCGDPQIVPSSSGTTDILDLQVTLQIPSASLTQLNLLNPDEGTIGNVSQIVTESASDYEIHCEDFLGNTVGESCVTDETGSCFIEGLTVEEMAGGLVCIGIGDGTPIYKLVFLTDDEITAAETGTQITAALDPLSSYIYALVSANCNGTLADCENADTLAVEIEDLIVADDTGVGATARLYEEFVTSLIESDAGTDTTNALIDALSGGDGGVFSTEYLSTVGDVLDALVQGEDPTPIDVLNAAPNVPSSLVCTSAPLGGSSGNVCTLTAAAAPDPDGDSVTYLDGGSTCTALSVSSNGQSITFTAPSKGGTCLVKVKAYDGTLYSTAVSSSTITGGNNPPNAPSSVTCDLDPIAGSTNNTCVLSSAMPDVDGDSVTYVDDGSTCTSISSNGSNVTFTSPALDTTCLVKIKAYDGTAYSDVVSSAIITGSPVTIGSADLTQSLDLSDSSYPAGLPYYPTGLGITLANSGTSSFLFLQDVGLQISTGNGTTFAGGNCPTAFPTVLSFTSPTGTPPLWSSSRCGGKPFVGLQDLNGELFSNITELSYRAKNTSGTLVTTYVNVAISLSGGSTYVAGVDDILVYDPAFSQPEGGIQANTFQTWDTTSAGNKWRCVFGKAKYDATHTCVTSTNYSLAQFQAGNPTATIVSPPGPGSTTVMQESSFSVAPGLELIVGQKSGAAPWTSFVGIVDYIEIKVSGSDTATRYEFR